MISRQRSIGLFPLVIFVFLLFFAPHPGLEAANYLSICTQSGSQIYPTSAWNSDQGEYLTVWQSGLEGDPNRYIAGLRVTASGEIKTGADSLHPYIISELKNRGVYSPSVACNPQKNKYLVTWYEQDETDTSSTKICASLISFDGSGKMVKKPISAIRKVKDHPSLPKVAWNGEQFLIVWYDWPNSAGIAGADIYGLRLDPNGTILDPNAFAICTSASAQTDPVVAGYHRAATEGGQEEKGWLVAWVDERNPASGKDIYAALIKQNADDTASVGESFPVCQAEKDQKSLSVAVGPQGFFLVWQDGRWKDEKDNLGNYYGNFLFGARVSTGGQLLPNSLWGTEIPIFRLFPYEGRIPAAQPSVACIQNNYLIVWDYKSLVYGIRISLEGELLDITPFNLSDSTKVASFPTVASGDADKALITCMVDSEQGQGNKDISGLIYVLPASPTLEWVEGNSGVSPDIGKGGQEFTFKVKYLKAEGGSDQPITHQVLIDINHNQFYEQNEIFDLSASGSGIYQKKITILYDGNQNEEQTISYKFYFRDEHNVAEGEPAKEHTFTIRPSGSVPSLSWLGTAGYTEDGVDPDSGQDGGNFTFQVRYQDADGSVPKTHQVWIDLNGNNIFDESEKFSLETIGSVNYAQGVTFRLTKTIQLGRAGLIPYRFFFDDGANVAQGEPKGIRCLTITNTAETCIHSGPATQMFPDVASLSTGSLVVWEDLRQAKLVDEKLPHLYQGSMIYGRMLDESGLPLEALEEIKIGSDSKAQFKPRLAAGSQGDVYLVVWEDLRNGRVETGGSSPGYLNTDIYGQIIDPADPDNRIELPIATYATDSLSGNQNNPAVAADGSGNRFLVVWEDSKDMDNSGKNIHAALISYDPETSTAKVWPEPAANDNFIIYDQEDRTDQINPAVAWGGGRYLVVWQDFRPEANDGDTYSHLYANPVDPNTGQVMAGQFALDHNKALGNPVCTDPNTSQEHPAIASDGNNFLVVWEHQSMTAVNSLFGKDIYGAIIGPDGRVVKPRFIICTLEGDQTNPRVFWDQAHGNYLVVWDSQPIYKDATGKAVPGYDTDIRGARITADGRLIGGAITSPGFEICAMPGFQKSPAISGSSSFSQIVWMDNRSLSPLVLSWPYGFDIYSTQVRSFLGWVEDEDFSSGVSPTIGGNGKTYTFKINYLDMDGHSPTKAQVWIDLNGDGQYSAEEKYTLNPDTADSDTADGQTYSRSIPLTLPPSYQGSVPMISYRFYFEDEDSRPAAGSANQSKAVQINSPWLFWTGEANYQSGGVNPTVGDAGTSFEFRVLYLYQPMGAEQTAGPEPSVAQLWIDLDHDGQYQSSEKYTMIQADPNDQNYADGKKYRYQFKGNTPGVYKYRFYFTHQDGGAAVGEPTQEHQFTISGAGSGQSPASLSWTTYTTSNTSGGLISDNITCLAFCRETLWVGTSGGLSRFDDPNHWQSITPAKEPNLAGSYITALAVDTVSNELYVGTSQGLSKYDGTSWKKYNQTTTGKTLDKNYIAGLAFDKVNRRLWIASLPGSQQGYGQSGDGAADANSVSNQYALIRYEISKNEWTSYTKENTSSHSGGGMPGEQIIALEVDGDGDVWMSTAAYIKDGEKWNIEYRGLSRFKVEEKEWTHYSTNSAGEGVILETNFLPKIKADESGYLWVSGISTDSQDTQGTKGGLYRFDIQSGRFIEHYFLGQPKVKLGSNLISALAVDKANSALWIGCYSTKADGSDGGLSRYDYDKDTWTLSTTADGLVDNRITAIVVHGQDVWVGTSKGLSRYGIGPGDAKKSSSYFNPENRFAFPDSSCFISALANSQNSLAKNSLARSKAFWLVGMFLLISAGCAFLYLVFSLYDLSLSSKEMSMGKKIVAAALFIFLSVTLLVASEARAASVRTGTLFELHGGFFRPSEYEKWEAAFGHTFSALGGLKLGQELIKNIELGFSADYIHEVAREWSVYYIPLGLSLTYALRYSQSQVLVPYLGGGVDFVYGKTGRIRQGNIKPTYLKESGYHAVAGIRLLLDALASDDAEFFDQKFGVNNSYLVLEARYLKLFNADYAEQEFDASTPGTGYFDPKGMLISLGFLVEF